MTENARHYCIAIASQPTEMQTKAALIEQFQWQPGTQVRVSFLEGESSLKDRVRSVAEEWVGPSMANLELQFVDDGDQQADVRIRFVHGNGSWSYLGTVAHDIAVGEPTMNYGWLTPDSDDDELRRVVLHEFGHALGLIHEHQNPLRPINWNRAAVIADLSGPPNNWDEGTIENNIFKRYEPEELNATNLDPQSIMMYPIPASWTTDGFSVGLNGELSGTDMEFIHKAYPW
ncbi:matrixin family metalloprotease [Geodermatophilus sp. SYSU D00710]